MEVEKESAKPRRTPLVLWLSLATAGLVLLLVGVSLFGPNPPIEIGKDTTRITTPLAADGLPDYAAALLAQGRIGKDGQPITPERNGAVPFLRAMWEYDDFFDPTEEQLGALCSELGIANPPPGPRLEALGSDAIRADALSFLRRRLLNPAGEIVDLSQAQWNRWDSQFYYDLEFLDFARRGTPDDVAAALEEMSEKLAVRCQPISRPWTASDLPFLAKWCDRNNDAIDLFIEAGGRPGWRLPPPGFISGERGQALVAGLPFVGASRHAAHMLQTRSMLHLGERRSDAAARDAIAMLQLGDHMRRGMFLVDQLVGCAIEGVSHGVIRNVVADDGLTVDSISALAGALESIDSRAAILDCINNGERLYGLDMASYCHAEGSVSMLELEGGARTVARFSIDWNPVFRAHNAHFDDCLTAARQPIWSERRDAFDSLESSVALQDPARQRSPKYLGALFSPSNRGALLAGAWLGVFAPATGAAFAADDRVTASRQLTRVAVALALCRHENGAYPDALDTLVPAYLPKDPVDLFHKNPLVYRKTDDGYLLYSHGANGRDDGGSCEAGTWGECKLAGVFVVDPDNYQDESVWDNETGEYIGATNADKRDEALSEVPLGADDISLRMPPVVEPWPWEIAPEGAEP